MKRILAAFFAAMLPALLAFSVHAAAVKDVSPAIGVLRRSTVLNKCGVFGESVTFERSDYESAVGTELRYLTVTALPDPASGTLKLNGINVICGQTVAAGSLDSLVFVPAENGPADAEFRFRVSAEGWESTDIKCRMIFAAKRNLPPVMVAEGMIVYKNASAEITVCAYDPDGDKVTYHVDGYPKSGTLSGSDGVLVYTPVKNFTGTDSLVVHAEDEYGNISSSAEYTFTVTGESAVRFADMADSPVHSQAIALAVNNIVNYRLADGAYLFEPKKQVSRIDFTVMLLTAAGVQTDAAVSALPFADSDLLSLGKRAYLAKAVSLGIPANETYFRPGESITCAEAASFVKALCGETLSASALRAVERIAESGEKPLTREDAVRLLCTAGK